MELLQPLIAAVVSGLIGGAVAGVAAVATMRVELRWHRRDIDHAQNTADAAHRRIDAIHGTARS